VKEWLPSEPQIVSMQVVSNTKVYVNHSYL